MYSNSIYQLLIAVTGIGSQVLAAPATPLTTVVSSAPPASITLSIPTALPTLDATAADACLPISETSAPLSIPLPPTNDSWYTPPDDWFTKSPGDILRFRVAPGNAVANLAFGSCVGAQAYNILYKTTDSHYQPTWAVTTVFAPLNARIGDAPYSMLSYQHPYDSANVNESPSYAIYDNGDLGGELQLALSWFLVHGWFVNVPDYEGPNAAFGAGVLSGHATLDSVRAALTAAKRVGVPVGFKGGVSLNVAMYGYSGGSFATEWAAELQSQYAPELQFVGAGIGGAFPNITSALGKLIGSGYEGHLKNLIAGIGNEHPDAQTATIRILQKTSWADAILSIKDMSSAQLRTLIDTLLQDSKISKIVNRDMMLGYHGVPEMPLLVHRADNDQISSTEDTTKLVDRYCGVGANIFYHVSHYGTTVKDPHMTEGVDGTRLATEGLARMFKGTFPKGCPPIDGNWSW